MEVTGTPGEEKHLKEMMRPFLKKKRRKEREKKIDLL
jgi:hypothetical protein